MTAAQFTNPREQTFENRMVVQNPPLEVNERVVWLQDSGPEYGTVRWVGILPDVGNDWTVGVELDNEVGNNDGSWGDMQLFTTKPMHGLIIPVLGLMKAEEFQGKRTVENHFSQIQSQKLSDTISRPSMKNTSVDSVFCIGERIVCNVEHGTIRWIGRLPNYPQIIAGVEFDNPVGSGSGMFQGEILFSAKPDHASFIPISNLIREERVPLYVCHTNGINSGKMENMYYQQNSVLKEGNYDNINWNSTNSGSLKRKCLKELTNAGDENGKQIFENNQPTVLALQLAADIASGNICNSVMKSESNDPPTGENIDLEKWYDAIDFSATHSLKNKSLHPAQSLESVSNSDEISSLSSLDSVASDKGTKEGSGFFSFFRWFRFRKNKKKEKLKLTKIDPEHLKASSVPSVTSISDSFHYVPINFGPVEKISTPSEILTLDLSNRDECKSNSYSNLEQVPAQKETVNNRCDTQNNKSEEVFKRENLLPGTVEKIKLLNPETSEKQKISTTVSMGKILRKKKRRAPSPPVKRCANEHLLRMNATLPIKSHFKHNSTTSSQIPLNKRNLHVKGKRRAPSPPLKNIDKICLGNTNLLEENGERNSDKSKNIISASIHTSPKYYINKENNKNHCDNTNYFSTDISKSIQTSSFEKHSCNALAVLQESNNESVIMGEKTGKKFALMYASSKEQMTSTQAMTNKVDGIKSDSDCEINDKISTHLVSDEWKNRNRSTQKLIDMFNALSDLAKVTDQLTYEIDNPISYCLQTNNAISLANKADTDGINSDIECKKSIGVIDDPNNLTFYINSNSTETVKLEITKTSEKINSFSHDSFSQTENTSDTLTSSDASNSESSDNGQIRKPLKLTDITFANDTSSSHIYENINETRTRNLHLNNKYKEFELNKEQENRHKESSFNWYKKFPHQQLGNEKENIQPASALSKEVKTEINDVKQAYDLNQRTKFSVNTKGKQLADKEAVNIQLKRNSGSKKGKAPECPSLTGLKEKTANVEMSSVSKNNNKSSSKPEPILHNLSVNEDKSDHVNSFIHDPLTKETIAQSISVSSSSLPSSSMLVSRPVLPSKKGKSASLEKQDNFTITPLNENISKKELSTSISKTNNSFSNENKAREFKPNLQSSLYNNHNLEALPKEKQENDIHCSSNFVKSDGSIHHSKYINFISNNPVQNKNKEISLFQQPFSIKQTFSHRNELQNKNVHLSECNSTYINSNVPPNIVAHHCNVNHNNQNMLTTRDYDPSVNADMFISQQNETTYQMEQSDNLCMKSGKKSSMPSRINEVAVSNAIHDVPSSDTQLENISRKPFEILNKDLLSDNKLVLKSSYNGALLKHKTKYNEITINEEKNKISSLHQYHLPLNNPLKSNGSVENVHPNTLSDIKLPGKFSYGEKTNNIQISPDSKQTINKGDSSGTCLIGGLDESLIGNKTNNGSKSLLREDFFSKLWPPLYEIVAPELVLLKAKLCGHSLDIKAGRKTL